MQILVNMLTNAIKFTKDEPVRKIHIRFGAYDTAPPRSMFGEHFAWSETANTRPADPTTNNEYGTGNFLYLYFAVTDTGQGLKSQEAIKIFDKFIQASRRTHIKYGGSGLGLFISRELAEMQAGRIGVQSAEGVGSTFAFYVKCRKSNMVHRKESAKGSLIDTPAHTVAHEVLLVEDNLLNQKVLAKQLRRIGCIVHVANNGVSPLTHHIMDYLACSQDAPCGHRYKALVACKTSTQFQ